MILIKGWAEKAFDYLCYGVWVVLGFSALLREDPLVYCFVPGDLLF